MGNTIASEEKMMLLEKTKPLKISFWTNIALMCFIIFALLFLPIFANGNGLVAQIMELIINLKDVLRDVINPFKLEELIMVHLESVVVVALIIYIIIMIKKIVRSIILYKTQKWGRAGVVSGQICGSALFFSVLITVCGMLGFFKVIFSNEEFVLSLECMIIGIGIPILGMIVSFVCNICTPLIRIPKEKIVYYITLGVCSVVIFLVLSNMPIAKVSTETLSLTEKREFVEGDLTLFSFNENIDAIVKFENGELVFDATQINEVYQTFENYNEFLGDENGGATRKIIIVIMFIGAASFMFSQLALFFVPMFHIVTAFGNLAIMKTDLLSDTIIDEDGSIEKFKKKDVEQKISFSKAESKDRSFNIGRVAFQSMWFGIIGYIILLFKELYGIIIFTINIPVLLIIIGCWIAIHLTWKQYYNKYVSIDRPSKPRKCQN